MPLGERRLPQIVEIPTDPASGARHPGVLSPVDSLEDPIMSFAQSFENEEKPPEYTPGMEVKTLDYGANMEPRSLFASDVYITIDTPVTNVFNRGDALVGRVVIAPSKDMPIGDLLIDLQMINILRKQKKYNTFRMTRSISLDRHKVPTEAYPEDRVLRRGLEYSFNYSMVIPTVIGANHCEHQGMLPLHFQLPPSIGSPSEMLVEHCDCPQKSVVIAYRIRARFTKPGNHSEKLLAAQQYRYLRVCPMYPPLLVEPEHTQKTVRLKGGIIKRVPVGELTMAVLNVPALSLTGATNTSFAHLQLKYKPLEDGTPPEIGRISRILVMHTLSRISDVPIFYYPKHDDPAVFTETEMWKAQKCDMAKSDWKQCQDGDNEYEMDVHVPLSLPEGVKPGGRLVPSFFSCTSSRQYEFKIQLFFTGLSSASIRFPVVVSRDAPVSTPQDEHGPLLDVDPVLSVSNPDRYALETLFLNDTIKIGQLTEN
uniref:ARAD1A18084p n=1 Tax=Blastobotrys adeninivorans TaxID=409370 RepID=A0A060T4J4_BLAAD